MAFFSDEDGGTPSLFVPAANTWYNLRDTYIVRFVAVGCRKNLPLHDLRYSMVDNPITIDDSLRLVFARLEGALGVFFPAAEIDRVFFDARENQRDEKHYVFFDSPKIRVAGYVEDYEPETIEITVKASRSLMARVNPIIADACDRGV